MAISLREGVEFYIKNDKLGFGEKCKGGKMYLTTKLGTSYKIWDRNRVCKVKNLFEFILIGLHTSKFALNKAQIQKVTKNIKHGIRQSSQVK